VSHGPNCLMGFDLQQKPKLKKTFAEKGGEGFISKCFDKSSGKPNSKSRSGVQRISNLRLCPRSKSSFVIQRP
jgi:hypothetical protein